MLVLLLVRNIRYQRLSKGGLNLPKSKECHFSAKQEGTLTDGSICSKRKALATLLDPWDSNSLASKQSSFFWSHFNWDPDEDSPSIKLVAIAIWLKNLQSKRDNNQSSMECLTMVWIFIWWMKTNCPYKQLEKQKFVWKTLSIHTGCQYFHHKIQHAWYVLWNCEKNFKIIFKHIQEQKIENGFFLGKKNR